MVDQVTLLTNRLLLRPWCEADRKHFAMVNADPIVMEHFPGTLTQMESDAMVDRIQSGFAERGWGLWAVELLARHRGMKPEDETNHPVSDAAQRLSPRPGFIGFVGLAIPRYEAHFTPCVEVGWRLERRAWGFGFATEAARASLHFGFETLKLDQIVSTTAVSNIRSQRVMQRLGMNHNPCDNFDHPLLPDDHRLRRHVLFRLARSDFMSELCSIDIE